jgi:hypothetical protein
MSMSFSTYIVPWEPFMNAWTRFAAETSEDDFWDDERGFYPFLSSIGDRYQWRCGYSHSYEFVYQSFFTISMKRDSRPQYYARFTRNIAKFLCEGSPEHIDSDDPHLKSLDPVYSLYNPRSVADICSDWDDVDWSAIEEFYNIFKRGVYDFRLSKEIVDDWVYMFRTAHRSGHGVLTIFA